MTSTTNLVSYARLTGYVAGEPWAILPAKLADICAVIARANAGERLDPDEVAAIVAAAPDPDTAPAILAARTAGAASGGAAVAVLPIYGTILQRAPVQIEASGVASAERIGAQFQALMASPDVAAVVLAIDSPGGTVSGVPELARLISREGRAVGKPVVAVADSMAASAAYWLASQADEVVVTPSGKVGSIGVMAAHTDVSKAMEMRGIRTTYITSARHKVEGAPDAPLSADAFDHIKATVDHYHAMFTRDVARGRGLSVATVRGEQYGEGRVYPAQAAVERGMADRVDTLQAVVASLSRGTWRRPERVPARADVDDAPVLASDPAYRLRRLRVLAGIA